MEVRVNPILENLEAKALDVRRTMLDMCINAGKGHVTSSLSCVDILVALYYEIMRVDPNNPKWQDRDRFILSKGQASPALYTILADLGFFSKDELKRFTKADGKFAVHLQKDVPGVEITAGSLGHGFGVAVGMALGAKMNCESHMIYALLGDGELYEGSIWETAMFASHHCLNNLVTIVDRNHLCVTDWTENLVALEPLQDKWAAFGFNVITVNGHDIAELVDTIAPLRLRSFIRPTVIIADTIKGKGCPSLYNDPLWHGVAPKGDMAERCRNELA